MERPFGVNLSGYFNSEKGLGEGVRSELRGLAAANIPHVLNNYMERKNPLGLIEAFRRAFAGRDDALLVLKCSRSNFCPEGLRALQEAAAGLHVKIIDTIFTRAEINSLMALADCYVSLHRSEGFGLTMAEAMNLGKPVIATAFSGNLDFMTGANSFLVSWSPLTIDRDHGPYERGQVWADPSLEHAAELMSLVFENRAKAEEIGRRAQRDVRLALSPEAVGRLVAERLRLIHQGLPKSAAVKRSARPQPELLSAVEQVRNLHAQLALIKGERKSARREAQELRQRLKEQIRTGDILTARVRSLEGREKDLEVNLLETRNQLADYLEYRQMIQAIGEKVATELPENAAVLVVSKGDDDLLRLGNRRAFHFPQDESGQYSGHYPPDSAGAIDHLDALCAQGADYLLFPAIALWWLDHYAEFKKHLEETYRRVVSEENVCVIYALRAG